MARSLIAALGIDRGDVVALVGAGGKTTLSLMLVDEAVLRGWSAVFTTTTRIGADQHGGHPVVVPDEFPTELRGGCVVGTAAAGGKLAGPGTPWIEAHRSAVDLMVVEADGAHGMRAKAPMPHEPVIPRSTDLVVAVMAADAIDRVIEDACHRPLRVGAVVGAGPYDRLTPERAAKLLMSPDGARKAVPNRFAVVITNVDGYEAERVGRLIGLLGEVRVVAVPAGERG